MKALLKIMLTLGLLFASTFLLINSTGLITVSNIESWLNYGQSISTIWVVTAVVLLLFLDLIIAVPTLTITILAGYFLGATLGAAASFIGMFCAGITGFVLSKYFGDVVFKRIVKSEKERTKAYELFKAHGKIIILLSRATPILPEVSACMAGASQMKSWQFVILWIIVTLPYVSIASYAGSISTLTNPMPAIYAAIGLSAFFWIGWLLFRSKLNGRNEVSNI